MSVTLSCWLCRLSLHMYDTSCWLCRVLRANTVITPRPPVVTQREQQEHCESGAARGELSVCQLDVGALGSCCYSTLTTQIESKTNNCLQSCLNQNQPACLVQDGIVMLTPRCLNLKVACRAQDGFAAPNCEQEGRSWRQLLDGLNVSPGDFCCVMVMSHCDCGTLHRAILSGVWGH